MENNYKLDVYKDYMVLSGLAKKYDLTEAGESISEAAEALLFDLKKEILTYELDKLSKEYTDNEIKKSMDSINSISATQNPIWDKTSTFAYNPNTKWDTSSTLNSKINL